MTHLLEDLGTLIRELRIKLGYSQEVLAKNSGLHRTYISDIERGERNLTFLNLVKIISALNLSISEFFQLLSLHSNSNL